MLTLKNAFFIPWYATKVLVISRTTFVKSMLPEVFSMAVTALASRLVANYFQVSGLISLLVSGIVLTLIYMCSLWTFVIENKERKIITKSLSFSRNNWCRKMKL